MARSTDRLPDDDPDVIDMHVERILAMTPEELRAEVIASGEDPDKLVEQSRQALERAVAQVAAMKAKMN